MAARFKEKYVSEIRPAIAKERTRFLDGGNAPCQVQMDAAKELGIVGERRRLRPGFAPALGDEFIDRGGQLFDITGWFRRIGAIRHRR